jgi:hypothetical protein
MRLKVFGFLSFFRITAVALVLLNMLHENKTGFFKYIGRDSCGVGPILVAERRCGYRRRTGSQPRHIRQSMGKFESLVEYANEPLVQWRYQFDEYFNEWLSLSP